MADRYFLSDISGDTALVTGPEADHLYRVMRGKPGDRIALTDGKGTDYLCSISEISPEKVKCLVLSKIRNEADPATKVTLYAGLPKGEKLELIVQKATEAGAFAVKPFVSRYCVAKKGKNSRTKAERLQKIAAEACKQCGRSIVPAVSEPVTFRQMTKELADYDMVLLFYEKGGIPLKEAGVRKGGKIAVITGSEGGFTPREARRLEDTGAVKVSLGKRILRCETAAITAVLLTLYEAGEVE